MWRTIHQLVSTRRYDVVQVIGDIPVYEYHELIQRLPSVITIPFLRSAALAMRLKMPGSWWRKRGLRREYHLFRAYEQWMFMPFDSVVMTTPIQAEGIRNVIQHPAIVIPLGVDSDYFVPTGYDPVSPAVLFIGDFTNPAEKEAALKLCQGIFPAIQKAIPETKLYVVGDDPGLDLQVCASENIFFIGAAPDLRPYFELATVYLSPLRQRMGIQENILKALAMMTPVVGTAVSFDGLEVENNQQVWIAENDNELIRRTIRLLGDSQERLRLQVNGLQQIQERYSWYQIANRYEALFQAMS
jgi:glycosyltransferase involved in cell wall biosynthesis